MHENLWSSISGHFWNQPKDYDFNTNESFSGGALDLDFRYIFFKREDNWLKGISVDIGMIYKTQGFIPEELYFEDHFGLWFGSSIRI